jgi:RNA polymerase sigma factor (TIGR02999 family)
MSDESYESSSSRRSLDDLFSITYEELRRVAGRVRNREGDVSLNPTALVNEVWLKLVKDKFAPPESAGYFKQIAARAMRQILIDASRRRRAKKRQWGVAATPEMLEVVAGEQVTAAELLALDAALDELAKINERQASIVELRFFGGMDIGETASVLQVSEMTVMRDWRVARAWLERLLRPVGQEAERA